MNTIRIGSTASLAAALLLAASGAMAQEYTLPPAPDSGADPAFTAENGPCFYNPYRWASRVVLNNTYLGAEIQNMLDPAGSGEVQPSGCSATYGLTPASFLGTWGYMAIDGQADALRAPYVSPEQVQAIKQASLEALQNERPGHAPVPGIGSDYGSDELKSQTIRFRVLQRQPPATYNGVRVEYGNRSMERVVTPDGRTIWREARPGSVVDDLGNPRGVRGQSSFVGDPEIQRQEGLDRTPRYGDRRPADVYRTPRSASPAPRSTPTPRAAPASPRSSSRSAGRTPKGGKKQ
jgi:hypothetical protein